MSDNPIGLESRRIAMLIDGDNAQPSLLGEMLAEAGKYGLVTMRRIYGDWTTANMGGWKDTLHTYAIQPIQQFRYTVGKNATDSAMIIDAMDILYTARVDGFCLVSSDSDYTRLATRIREKSLFVMGIGKKLTTRSLSSTPATCSSTRKTCSSRHRLHPEKKPKPRPSSRRRGHRSKSLSRSRCPKSAGIYAAL